MVYDQLAVKVGEHLGVESTHLRFWYLNSNTGRPKGPMRRSPTSSLASLLGLNGPQYVNGGAIHNQRTDYLYYEKLEYSLTEMETRKNIKVNWVYDGIQKEVRMRTYYTLHQLTISSRSPMKCLSLRMLRFRMLSQAYSGKRILTTPLLTVSVYMKSTIARSTSWSSPMLPSLT